MKLRIEKKETQTMPFGLLVYGDAFLLDTRYGLKTGPGISLMSGDKGASWYTKDIGSEVEVIPLESELIIQGIPDWA